MNRSKPLVVSARASCGSAASTCSPTIRASSSRETSSSSPVVSCRSRSRTQPRISTLGSCPAPRRAAAARPGRRGDPHAVDLRPRRAGAGRAGRIPPDHPRQPAAVGLQPLELLLGLRDDLPLSLPGHRPVLPNTLPLTCGPRRSRCSPARCRPADARSCRSTPAPPAAPTANRPAPPPTPGRCRDAPAGSGPGAASRPGPADDVTLSNGRVQGERAPARRYLES
jgi:hypothetical protein